MALFLGDNGTMYFWDWKTGYNFQRFQATVQPGSLDSEAGVFAMIFDQSQSRLITCEADKTVKIYKEDDTAVSNSYIYDIKRQLKFYSPPKRIRFDVSKALRSDSEKNVF
jgi:pleiotropic regulator 1